jgi:hypothetical protein
MVSEEIFTMFQHILYLLNGFRPENFLIFEDPTHAVLPPTSTTVGTISTLALSIVLIGTLAPQLSMPNMLLTIS